MLLLTKTIKNWCTHVLVDDAFDLHGLHNISDELRVCVRVSDLIVQQGSNAALKTHSERHDSCRLTYNVCINAH